MGGFLTRMGFDRMDFKYGWILIIYQKTVTKNFKHQQMHSDSEGELVIDEEYSIDHDLKESRNNNRDVNMTNPVYDSVRKNESKNGLKRKPHNTNEDQTKKLKR